MCRSDEPPRGVIRQYRCTKRGIFAEEVGLRCANPTYIFHEPYDWWIDGRSQKKGCQMKNEFTAIIEQDDHWYIAYCPEIPGANGQGKTKDEARESLAEAIALILEDRREEGLRGVPPEAIRETVTVS